MYGGVTGEAGDRPPMSIVSVETAITSRLCPHRRRTVSSEQFHKLEHLAWDASCRQLRGK